MAPTPLATVAGGGTSRCGSAMKVFAPLVISLLAVVGAGAEEPLAPQIASYDIDARLDPEARTVTATSTLRWKNTGREPVSELCLHLYLNAFDNDRTSLMEGRPAETRRWVVRHPGEWGGIDVLAIRAGDRFTGLGSDTSTTCTKRTGSICPA